MRRWVRRFLALFVVTLLIAVVGLAFATRHLDTIAEWAVERVFPGVDVKMKSLRAASFSELEVREFELRSRETDELLLRLEDGSVEFAFADLLGWKLEEVRLTDPTLRVSPALGEALGESGGTGVSAAREAGGPFEFSIGRVVIENGSLAVASFFDRTPTVTMKVDADWKNFGTVGDFGSVRHEVKIRDLAVRRGDEEPFLGLEEAAVVFTTAGLFSEQRVESVKMAAGKLRVPDDWAAMVPEFGGEEADSEEQVVAGERGEGWSVGALDLEGFQVKVGPAEFVAEAQLRELAAGNATDVQRVELRKVRVAGADGQPLVAANRGVGEFTVAGLLAKDVELVRLGYPRVWLRPELGDETPDDSVVGSAEGSDAAGDPWRIGRLVSDYGEVTIYGAKGRVPTISAKVAFDLKDVGTSDGVVENLHAVTVWDVAARAEGAVVPFLTLDVAAVEFSIDGLLNEKTVAGVTVDGGQLTIGEQFKGFLDGEGAGDTGGGDVDDEDPDGASKAWTIGSLDLQGVRTRLEDERVDVSDVNFTINSTFKNVAMGAARDGLAEEVQTVEFANLVIRSPVDPAAKIVTLRSVFVRFTLSGLANQQVNEVVILSPTVFLSQDLFVYMEAATGGDAGAAAVVNEDEIPAAPGWEIDKLEVKFGSLVIGSGGRSDVGLPLEFETLAENVEFDNLAALKLRAALRIPKQSYAFESYQLELWEVEGDLQFSYPPELGVKNVVQKLDIDQIRWRQYEADEAWLAVTFDEQGINGEFGAEAYAGYVNGGFSFFFQTDSPWIGWVAGTAVDTKRVSGIVSPENFSLTGPVDFEVQVDAFSKNIDRVRGKFALKKSGVLKIGKIDDLLENLSPDWWSVKRDLTRIGLEALRDFNYEDASGDFWFVQSQGILRLDLAGPNGSRDFEVALHDGEGSGGRWQLGEMKLPE